VVIDLEVRRFFCGNAECQQRTFAEQVPAVTQRHQHRTPLLRGLLEAVALALAGRAGTRLASALGIVVSRSTLIRLIRALPDPVTGQVTVLGVDDFAKRRGHCYATILIDMDTHRPIDVLDDRQATTFTEWLEQHPGVQSSAATGPAPTPKAAGTGHQRRSRWPTGSTYGRTCAAQPKKQSPPAALTCTSPHPSPAAHSPPGPAVAPAPLRWPPARARAAWPSGHNLTQICQMLGLTRNTVRKFARAAAPEHVTAGPRPHTSGLDHFAACLHQRWNQGCTDAAALHAEITEQGYQGGERSVRRYLQPLRASLPATAPPPPPPTVREVTRWITSHPDHLTEDDTAQLNKIKTRSPQLAATAGHVTTFAEMMTGRHGQHLPAWITAAGHDDLPHLHSFTRGIRQDQAAVTNGLTLPHSSGAVEGSICRVQALKRQKFGRANLDLLRERILIRT
jgi:hypothetical protein